MSRRTWGRVAVVVVTVVSAWLTASHLRLSADMSALFPSSGDARALGRWTRVFGGRDPAVVLVRGASADDVAAAADAIAEGLRHAPSVERVLDRAPALAPPRDPTLAWAVAGKTARARLAAIVTPEGMRERLAGTRDLLLAPALDARILEWLARDPLRLAQVPWEERPPDLLSGLSAAPGSAFSADEGRARLVVAQPKGSAFESEAARALVEDVERVFAAVARPGVAAELTGGHAIARDIEQTLKRDLAVSGGLSLVLAALAFVVTFRRARALVAVLPPLALGTLWTTGLAALVPQGLDAVAIAFAAVVVGVGVDTGVHVYGALLDARRQGFPPHEAAHAARRAVGQPTLTAALVAAAAFASLALGELRAMRELGLLCAAGELLTAVAILLVTPEVGAWLERRDVPPEARARWVDVVVGLTATRRRALLAAAVCALPLGGLLLAGWPRPADALVAMTPRGLPSLVAEEHVRALFGGRGLERIVLTADVDEQRARQRADRLAGALDDLVRQGAVEGVDALATFAPSEATVRARLDERDALDLPGRRPALEQALREAGFDLRACAPALEAFSHPTRDLPSTEPSSGGDLLPWLLGRHLRHDGAETLVATYVLPAAGPAAEARLRAAVASADPASVVTGLDAIERALHDVLERDLWLVGAVAIAIVGLAMRVALRSARYALVALATLACEMAVVGVAMRVLAVRWHVYDALVLPVLFGVTIDESMFLLAAARERSIEDALRAQAPLVVATALTTAAGFLALLACRYQGLRDLGAVGAIGVLAGLAAALVVVPAALRGLSRDGGAGV